MRPELTSQQGENQRKPKLPEKAGAQDFGDNFALNVARYLHDLRASEVLRPHQRSVFEDLLEFFNKGLRRGYIELPTGTGKTVLFVELSKALLGGETTSRKLRILVVTPTKDLVHQTLGRAGKRGYGRFAPDLKVGSFFSDTPLSEKDRESLASHDVTVTTYLSLLRLARMSIFRDAMPADHLSLAAELQRLYPNESLESIAVRQATTIKKVPTAQSVLDEYDVLIFDEAHHVFGQSVAAIVKSLPDTTVAIGLTATPDQSATRKLTEHFPEAIHSLGLSEAVELQILAPIVPLGIRSGVRVRGSNLYDQRGEFIDARIGSLSKNRMRNKLIVDTAKVLVGHGVGTIISCIAGDTAWHARYLAEELERRGVRAVAVHKDVSARERQQIYEQFEAGAIDVLTFVGVLSEGWDSTRAKAVIGARPTRSLIFSTQRMGRITRPGAVAFAIDILDEYEGNNPVLTMADVLERGDQAVGSVVGEVEEASAVHAVIASLQAVAPIMPVLPAQYQEFAESLEGLPELTRGVLVDEQQLTEWAVPSHFRKTHPGVTDEILAKLEEMTGTSLSKNARQGNLVLRAYKYRLVKELLYNLPTVELGKLFQDATGLRFIHPEGLTLLFSKKFPKVTVELVEELLEQLDIPVHWTLGRLTGAHYSSRLKVVKLYLEKDIAGWLGRALEGHFRENGSSD